MVSVYRVDVGYNSNFSREEVWEELKAAVAIIRRDPTAIRREVIRLEQTPDLLSIEKILPFYADDIDLTLKIKEEEDTQGPHVMQFASGGDPMRDAKESCRRAVCRLLLEHMHRKKMEVNIFVV